MFLRAGALSLGLLLASRLLGLARESAQAAAFGASAMGDVAVLMLTLPDWLAGVLASGALAYALLPAWAQQAPAQVAATQRRVARDLLLAGTVLACLLAWGRFTAIDWLAAGLPASARASAAEALIWSAVALPLALLAALWATRLQHEREFVGMYAANLVVNCALIAALGLAAWGLPASKVRWLGVGLFAAMALRLAWLHWRQRRFRPDFSAGEAAAVPGPSVWLWAALAAGLPLALPFAARSIASQSGEGALATFNYAWKLVELPLVLAIQLVAALALPAIARAMAGEASRKHVPEAARHAIRCGFALAWTLACAAAAVVTLAAPALAQLLFGWGRMQPEALARVAEWGRVGAWSLLPQALIAVGLAVLAAQSRMRAAALAYGAALVALAVLGFGGVSDGRTLMLWIGLLLAGVAFAIIVALGRSLRQAVPWRALSCGALALGLTQAARLGDWLPRSTHATQLAFALAAGFAVLGAATWLSADVRASLRR